MFRLHTRRTSDARRLLLGAATAFALFASATTAQAVPFAYVPTHGFEYDSGISQYEVGAGGLLTPLVPPTAGGEGRYPNAVAVSPDGNSVYVPETDSSVVWQFDVGAGGGIFPKSPFMVATGEGPLDVAVSPDGQSVYVANSNYPYGPGSVSQYDVGSGGRLSPKSPATVAAGDRANAVAVSPDGGSVYVANYVSGGDGSVSQYDVGAGGELSPKSPATVAAGDGPNAVAVSPDGGSVYVANENSDSVSQYDVGAGGALSPKSPAAVAAGDVPRDVAVSPDGGSVYVANYVSGGDGSVSQYDVGAGGELSPKSPATVAAGGSPNALAVSPDGHSVYVVNVEYDPTENIFQFDVGPDGTLSPKSPATVATEPFPVDVAVGPGAHVNHAATLVKDIRPGSASSGPGGFTNLAGRTFFGAVDPAGAHLWKTDGTEVGTKRVTSTGISPGFITKAGGKLFFQAGGSGHGRELWKSDGTAAGTKLVKDINPGSNSSNPSGLTSVAGKLYFRANDGTHGVELWKSDGTAAGTTLVKDIRPAGKGSDPNRLTAVATRLYFRADDGTHGGELWKSNGTVAGTKIVRDVNRATGARSRTSSRTSPVRCCSAPTAMARTGASSGSRTARRPGRSWSRTSTWKRLLVPREPEGRGQHDVLPGQRRDTRRGALEVRRHRGRDKAGQGHLPGRPFTRREPVPRHERGRHALLQRLRRPGRGALEIGRHRRRDEPVEGHQSRGSSSPLGFTDLGGAVILAARDGAHGNEPWESNGTGAGTGLVEDINPGSASSSPRSLTSTGVTILFSANDGTHGTELWRLAP